MKRRLRTSALCLVLLGVLCPISTAPALSTAGVVSETLEATFACMAWQPVGLCFWLDCGFTGCRVKTSLKIGHYAPDLVVGAYNALGDYPWSEAGAVLEAVEHTAVGGLLGALAGTPAGSGMNRRKTGSRQNLIYRDVAALGHPMTVLRGGGLRPQGTIAFGNAGLLDFATGMLSFSDVAQIPDSIQPYFQVMHPCVLAGSCPGPERHFVYGPASAFELVTRVLPGDDFTDARVVEGFEIPNPRLGDPEESATLFIEKVAGGFRWPFGGIAGVAFGLNVLGGLLCPAAGARPGFPHYLSSLDALAWRSEIPEIFFPASLVPGLREIGSWPAHTWGSVYPRTGWTTQTDEAKAAAVLVQRAGDIVTRAGQPHVYVPVGTGGTTHASGMRVWLPPLPLHESDRRGGRWQMLSPVAERQCRLFGESDLTTPSSWGGGRIDPGGDYLWNLWRPYRCCSDRGLFLFDIDFASFP